MRRPYVCLSLAPAPAFFSRPSTVQQSASGKENTLLRTRKVRVFSPPARGDAAGSFSSLPSALPSALASAVLASAEPAGDSRPRPSPEPPAAGRARTAYVAEAPKRPEGAMPSALIVDHTCAQRAARSNIERVPSAQERKKVPE